MMCSFCSLSYSLQTPYISALSSLTSHSNYSHFFCFNICRAYKRGHQVTNDLLIIALTASHCPVNKLKFQIQTALVTVIEYDAVLTYVSIRRVLLYTVLTKQKYEV